MSEFLDASITKLGSSGTEMTMILKYLFLNSMRDFETVHYVSYSGHTIAASTLCKMNLDRIRFKFFPALRTSSTRPTHLSNTARTGRIVLTGRVLTRYRKRNNQMEVVLERICSTQPVRKNQRAGYSKLSARRGQKVIVFKDEEININSREHSVQDKSDPMEEPAAGYDLHDK